MPPDLLTSDFTSVPGGNAILQPRCCRGDHRAKSANEQTPFLEPWTLLMTEGKNRGSASILRRRALGTSTQQLSSTSSGPLPPARDNSMRQMLLLPFYETTN